LTALSCRIIPTVKPRIFIGSSLEAQKIANAIHSRLQRVAECTPWTAGAFGLSQTTMAELIRNLHDSDFGIFVFAPDDVATIRLDLLNIPRDNVVYEAGLFGGRLGPERCFIAVPQGTSVHVPTDLLGMTLGSYEDVRSDKNYQSAVNSFCSEVEIQIAKHGLFEGGDKLRELSVKFETLDYIGDPENKLKHKRNVAAEIKNFCVNNPTNKHRLLAEHRASYVPLFSAIISRPEEGDCELLLKTEYRYLPPHFAYYWLLDSVEAIMRKGCCGKQQLTEVSKWLSKLPTPKADIAARIASLAHSL
jgi:Predicted nucleotide-binding protein containing TIR-like domain